MFVLLLSFSLVVAFGCGVEDDPVAIVNGEEIPRSEFEMHMDQTKEMFEQQGMDVEEDEELFQQVKDDIVNHLIEQTLISQEVERRNIEVSQEEVDAVFSQFEEQFSDEEFEEFLAQSGLGVDEMYDMIEQDLKSQALVEDIISDDEPEIEVTEEEVEETYEQQRQMYEAQEGIEEVPSLEDLRPQIEAQLEEQKLQQYQGEILENLIEDLKEDSEIEILI